MGGKPDRSLQQSVDYSKVDPNASGDQQARQISKQQTTPGGVDGTGLNAGATIDSSTVGGKTNPDYASGIPDAPPPPPDLFNAKVQSEAIAKRKRLLSAGGRAGTFLTGGTNGTY